MRSDTGEIHQLINAAQQMIGGNVVLQRELVEQLFLHHLPWAKHQRLHLLARMESAFALTANHHDFFNTIAP